MLGRFSDVILEGDGVPHIDLDLGSALEFPLDPEDWSKWLPGVKQEWLKSRRSRRE